MTGEVLHLIDAAIVFVVIAIVVIVIVHLNSNAV